jgi:cytoskeletal protein CcmA (bactofilin family)
MFGRRGDEPGSGGRAGETPELEPRGTASASGAAGAGGSSGTEVFPGGIRVDSSRRRPIADEAPDAERTPTMSSSDSGDRPPLVVRQAEPRPAVPPSAGGAHRAAVYRTAPEQPEQPEQQEAPAMPVTPEPSAAPETTETMSTATVTQGAETMPEQGDSKKLVVGRGIVLKGEISNCDALVVEGTVEANLSGCRSLLIGESGVVTGKIQVEEATVAGHFKGSLAVRQVLSIKSGGQVRGEVRYGALQVDSGGVLAGSADTNTGNDEGEGADAAAASGSGGGFGTRSTAPGSDD